MIEVVYIAGPLTSPNEEERLRRIELAEETALELERHGISTILVHSKARTWWGKIDETLIIQNDLALLERSDGVVLLPGWEYSRGTVGEILHARWHALPCWEPGMFLAGPILEARDRITPPIDLLMRARVEPHPASIAFGTPDAQLAKRELVASKIVG